MSSFEQLLERAASLHGIDAGYWDVWGQYHTTSVETRQALLRALGVDGDSLKGLERSLAELARREWERLLPPSVVAVHGAAPELTLNVPAAALGQTAHFEVRREDGGTARCNLHLWELPAVASREMDGQTWVRVKARLPVELPLGYHEILVDAGLASGATRFIVTPEHAWTDPHLGHGGRGAGICVSLYGVRSGRNWGCGDFGDLNAVTDWAARDLGAGFVGLNPLHAIHNRRPYNNSPYLPNSIYYQNFLYLDVEAMDDFARSRHARALRLRPETAREIEELRQAPFVEYERVSALKLRFLKLMFVQFLRERRRRGPREREFAAYCAREGLLLQRFATYCALDEVMHRRNPDVWIWTQWPEEYQDPQSDAVRAFQHKHWRRVMFYQYLQWQIDRQLHAAQMRARERGLSIGLYHDLALATDRFGSDLWGHREFFVNGCRVGSPPDAFSPKGQDWAFPPPNSMRHREDGYHLYAESIRKNCRHGGALRIDHVMRLFRLFWIPDGMEATEGTYVRELNEDFVRILALESVRNQVTIVGEDLGTVEPSIRETLARFGILSYRLFYFEKENGGGFHPYKAYPAQALVSSTTHDLPTLAGFWVGADIEARRSTGLIDDEAFRAQQDERRRDKQQMLDALFQEDMMRPDLPREAEAYPEMTGELHHAVVGFLALTPSALLAINQEDLTKEVHQQNLPGSTWQYPNWCRKMRLGVEELRQGEGRGYTAMFADWIERSGRRNVS
ncbi:MAG TPA: 4-alpha-glucanotransferase [Candidatus Acidoferrales bacterium]|nr:4-alpha-glucanotransferase [Candidatus Acidoferrales bacterium]